MSEWFDMKHMSKHNVGYVGHFIQSMKEAGWTVLYFVKIVIHGFVPFMFPNVVHNKKVFKKSNTPEI
tara:strand:+ start:567 stop:767 length:201 start_codon:yes stop_codon:yes gene_type:complete